MRHNLHVVDSLWRWGKFLSARRAPLTTTEIERLYWGALCCNTINIVGAGSAEIPQCCRNLRVLQKVCRVFQKVCRYCRARAHFKNHPPPPHHPSLESGRAHEKSQHNCFLAASWCQGNLAVILREGSRGDNVLPVILLVFTICWLDKIVSGGYISFLVRITAVYF